MSKIRLYGDTSGYLELKAPAVAPDAAVEIPAAFGPYGKVLQVVTATDATLRSTTSTSFVDAGISVSITPLSASSTIYVMWNAVFGVQRNGDLMRGKFQITDSSNTALSGAEGSGDTLYIWCEGGNINILSFVPGHIIGTVAATDTSTRTYKGRFAVTSGGTSSVRNSTQTGQLIAVEVGV